MNISPELLSLISGLVGALIGSVSSIVVTGLNLKNQYKLKAIESKAQMELKAKELLFNSYQQRMETMGKELSSYGSALGQITGTLAALDDDEEKRKTISYLVKTFTPFMNLFSIAVDELEWDIDGAGLVKLKAQVKLLRENSNIDLEEATPEELEQHLHLMFKSVTIVNMLNQAVLNRKCENLFGEYVNNAIVKR
jgi:hypothetical protein